MSLRGGLLSRLGYEPITEVLGALAMVPLRDLVRPKRLPMTFLVSAQLFPVPLRHLHPDFLLPRMY